MVGRFVPALNVIATRLNIPDDVAGATLMAGGASSPELIASLVALFLTHSSLGIGTIVGSEIFNQLLICAGSVYSGKIRAIPNMKETHSHTHTRAMDARVCIVVGLLVVSEFRWSNDNISVVTTLSTHLFFYTTHGAIHCSSESTTRTEQGCGDAGSVLLRAGIGTFVVCPIRSAHRQERWRRLHPHQFLSGSLTVGRVRPLCVGLCLFWPDRGAVFLRHDNV